jgi:hypothetical protein
MMTGVTVDSTSVFTADTLQGIDIQEEFSIGRYIPFSVTDSRLTGGTFPGNDHQTYYYATTGRADGLLWPQEKMSIDFGFILLSACLLLITVITVFGRKSIATGFAYLSFRRQPELSAPGTSEVISWPPIFRNIFTILNISLFASVSLLFTDTLRYNGTAASIKLTAIISGSLLAALMLRHLTCIIMAEVSGKKSVYREYMNVIYNTWFADAIILFILNAIILFAPLNNTLPVIISGIIITAIFLVIRILRLLTIFINRHISVLYFILYLCALEVLPVLVIMKMLGVF